MALGDLQYRSRSARPRPISFLGIIAFFSCRGCLRPFFSQPPDGGAGGGSGGAGDFAQPVLLSSNIEGATNQVGAEIIHSSDSKNDHNPIEKLMLLLITIQHSLASIDNSLKTLVNYHVFLDDRLTTMENRMATSQGPSTAPVLTDTPANKDAVNRMKGLLGSLHSVADKLLVFCTSVMPWLLSNFSAPKAGQNFEDPGMQFLIMESILLYHISFYTLFLASKFKDSESIDGVLFKIYMWLLLLVFLGLSSELFMIVHIFAHTPIYVILPLGIVLSILSVAFWFWVVYKEHQKIQEELKPKNGALPENPVPEATWPKV